MNWPACGFDPLRNQAYLQRVRNPIFFLLLLVAVSCGPRSVVLQDGRWLAPASNAVFRHWSEWDPSITREIDTAALYESVDETDGSRERLGSGDGYFSVLRLYGNGRLVVFYKDASKTLSARDLDSSFSGDRGILYRKAGAIRGEIFTQTNGIGQHGVIPMAVTPRGDTLIVTARNGSIVYQRRYIRTTTLLPRD